MDREMTSCVSTSLSMQIGFVFCYIDEFCDRLRGVFFALIFHLAFSIPRQRFANRARDWEIVAVLGNLLRCDKN